MNDRGLSVRVVGVPWDEHSSHLRGCAAGPERICAALTSGASNLCAESGIDLAADPRFELRADLDVAAGTAAFESIVSAIDAQRDDGGRLIALGGDHAITYPIVHALAPAFAGLTILHLDAHPDLYDEFNGDRLSPACPFARIMEEGLARRLVQLGIRTMNPHQRAQAERFGVEVVPMSAWRDDLDLGLTAPLYVSIDLDALDPAYAPGVSHHEPGGFTVREVVRLVRELPVAPIGADVVELNPSRDHCDRTAAVAAKLVKELAARMLEASRDI